MAVDSSAQSSSSFAIQIQVMFGMRPLNLVIAHRVVPAFVTDEERVRRLGHERSERRDHASSEAKIVELLDRRRSPLVLQAHHADCLLKYGCATATPAVRHVRVVQVRPRGR